MNNNLSLNVIKTNDLLEKCVYIKKFIELQEKDSVGVLYVITRTDTKIYSDMLNYLGIKSTYYHNKLYPNIKEKNISKFNNKECKIIVSTNAILQQKTIKCCTNNGNIYYKNKKLITDVDFVIHISLCDSLYSYYKFFDLLKKDSKEPLNLLLLYCNTDNVFINTIYCNFLNKKIFSLLLYRNDSITYDELLAQIGDIRKDYIKKIFEKDFANVDYIKKDDKKIYFDTEHKEIALSILKLLKNESLTYNKLLERLNYSRKDLIKKVVNDFIIMGFIWLSNKDKKLNISNRLERYEKTMTEIQKNFNSILDYINTKNCRSKFIYDFLKNSTNNISNFCEKNGLCDNCLSKTNSNIFQKINSNDLFLKKEINKFFDDYSISSYNNKDYGRKEYQIVSAGYYAFPKILKYIKLSKVDKVCYFDDYLLNITINTFFKYYTGVDFDYILFVPHKNDLLKNFVTRFSNYEKIKIPVKDDLVKIKDVEKIKYFKNKIAKEMQIKGMYKLNNPEKYYDKTILLIDDIFDSGCTINEIYNTLNKTLNGRMEFYAITIAKKKVPWEDNFLEDNEENQMENN